MKERPILFSAPMVRAILDGRKTQTRRVVNLDKAYHDFHHEILEWRLQFGRWFGLYEYNTVASCKCPYGEPGDRLWVRETWMPFDRDHCPPNYAYRASATSESEEIRQEYIHCGRNYRWRPSIHMPRAASRITLEITDVRVERLQDISEQDAIAEGVRLVTKDEKVWKCCVYDRGDTSSTPWADMPRNAVPAFQSYIKNHGHMDWDANPWVWVVSFEVVK